MNFISAVLYKFLNISIIICIIEKAIKIIAGEHLFSKIILYYKLILK